MRKSVVGGRVAMALAVLAVTACSRPLPPLRASADVDWPYYGDDEGGQRYSAAAQITRGNVGGLRIAWKFSTGDGIAKPMAALRRSAFEATPILAGGRLYVCSPFNEAFALDPATGVARWRYDARIDTRVRYDNGFVCRGLAYWRDPTAPAGSPCAERVFMATNDRRLIALDAATGRTCINFGGRGAVDVAAGVTLADPAEMQITSPPVTAGDTIVVGSAIYDNRRAKEISGAVRAYDVRSGARRWSFDPLAAAGPGIVTGAANVWAPMSVDEARGLIFLPTTSPSPDFWGGLRPGSNGDASSVVALHARTGTVAWAFQTVHHDIWDYDNPAQPTLAVVRHGGRNRPAVLQPTKQGLIFTLDRQSGAPIIPVVERKVPQDGAPGEVLSPTQPIPIAPMALSPSRIEARDAFGLTPFDREACRRMIAASRHEGLYTPPSTRGTIIYPFDGGGMNWGGLAFDPRRGIAFVNTSSALQLITLIPAAKFDAARRADTNTAVEYLPQSGAPFGARLQILLSPLGLPCNPPPWGQLHAVDMNSGRVLWQVPLGTTQDKVPFSQFLLPRSGVPNFGGPIVTASGLVFIGAAVDDFLRAFDSRTGKELWEGRLPAGGQATPMTYIWKGRQYVVIAAGGHVKSGTRVGDSLVAFALP